MNFKSPIIQYSRTHLILYLLGTTSFTVKHILVLYVSSIHTCNRATYNYFRFPLIRFFLIVPRKNNNNKKKNKLLVHKDSLRSREHKGNFNFRNMYLIHFCYYCMMYFQ